MNPIEYMADQTTNSREEPNTFRGAPATKVEGTVPGFFTYGEKVPRWALYAAALFLVVAVALMIYNNALYTTATKQRAWASYPSKDSLTALNAASNALWPFPVVNVIVSLVANFKLRSAEKAIAGGAAAIASAVSKTAPTPPLTFGM